jgi:hypothetical protein
MILMMDIMRKMGKNMIYTMRKIRNIRNVKKEKKYLKKKITIINQQRKKEIKSMRI